MDDDIATETLNSKQHPPPTNTTKRHKNITIVEEMAW